MKEDNSSVENKQSVPRRVTRVRVVSTKEKANNVNPLRTSSQNVRNPQRRPINDSNAQTKRKLIRDFNESEEEAHSIEQQELSSSRKSEVIYKNTVDIKNDIVKVNNRPQRNETIVQKNIAEVQRRRPPNKQTVETNTETVRQSTQARRPLTRNAAAPAKVTTTQAPAPQLISRGTSRNLGAATAKPKLPKLEDFDDENYPEHYKLILKAKLSNKDDTNEVSRPASQKSTTKPPRRVPDSDSNEIIRTATPQQKPSTPRTINIAAESSEVTRRVPLQKAVQKSTSAQRSTVSAQKATASQIATVPAQKATTVQKATTMQKTTPTKAYSRRPDLEQQTRQPTTTSVRQNIPTTTTPAVRRPNAHNRVAFPKLKNYESAERAASDEQNNIQPSAVAEIISDQTKYSSRIRQNENRAQEPTHKLRARSQNFQKQRNNNFLDSNTQVASQVRQIPATAAREGSTSAVSILFCFFFSVSCILVASLSYTKLSCKPFLF